MNPRVWNYNDIIDIHTIAQTLHGVSHCKLLNTKKTMDNDAGLRKLSATLRNETMQCQFVATTSFQMKAREFWVLSANRSKLERNTIFTIICALLNFCSYLDSHSRENTVWRNFGHPVLELAIRNHKKNVSK